MTKDYEMALTVTLEMLDQFLTDAETRKHTKGIPEHDRIYNQGKADALRVLRLIMLDSFRGDEVVPNT